MDPSDFWYIKLRENGSRGDRKKPAESWGSYSDDFRELDNVYTWEETQEKAPNGNWGIVGYNGREELLVIDADLYKVADEIDDVDKLKLPDQSGFGLVFSEEQGREVPGVHIYVLLQDGDGINSNYGWVDLKGEVAKGHSVSPFHTDNGYRLSDDERTKELSVYTDVHSVNDMFTWGDTPLLKHREVFRQNYEIDKEPPDDMPKCYRKALEQRAGIPRDGTFGGNPWKVDSYAGMLGVAHGYDIEEMMDHMAEYDPNDGYDPDRTRSQLEYLFQKKLSPPSIGALRAQGILTPEESCGCGIKYHSGSEAKDDLDILVPTDDNGQPIIHDEPPETADPEEPFSLLSVARAGKTWTLTNLAANNIEDKRAVYIAPTHDEAHETYEKFTENHGADCVWLCGERYAREKYDVTTTGDPHPGMTVRTPEQASEFDNFNAYATLINSAQNAQFVVTVPELMDRVGDYDLLLCSEESAMSRLTSGSNRLVEAQRSPGNRARVHGDVTEVESRLKSVMDKVQDQEAHHKHHKAIREAVNSLLNISWKIRQWNPATWDDVQESWKKLLADIQTEVTACSPNHDFEVTKIETYLSGYQSVEGLIKNMIYKDGLFTYENSSGRHQLFLCSEPNTVTKPVDEDATIWLAGFAKHDLDLFHREIGGEEPPEPYAYTPQTPVLDETQMVFYTGGKNSDQQTGILRNAIREIQNSSPMTSIFTVEGNSDRAATLAESAQRSWTPSHQDDKADLKEASASGFQVCAAVTSRFSKGIDTPFFDVGAMTHGRFAAPLEDYIAENEGDRRPKLATVGQAAQNALLRTANTPSADSRDTTPVLTGDRHVPDVLVEVLKAYGANMMWLEDIDQVIKLILRIVSKEDYDKYVGDKHVNIFSKLRDTTSTAAQQVGEDAA